MRNPPGTELPPRRDRIARARAAIERASSWQEIKTIRDQAEVMRQYAARQRMGLEVQNTGAEIKLRAERRLGEWLAEREPNKGAAEAGWKTRSHDATALDETDEDSAISKRTETLQQLGVSKSQSSRWQRLADVPEEDFEQYLSDTRDKGEEITSKGAAVLAARGWLRDPLSYLAPSERCLIATRLHWFAPLRAMFRAGVGMAVMTAVLMLLVAAAPGAFLPKALVCIATVAHSSWLLWRGLRWHVERIIVTDRRIVHVHGVFTTAVDSVQLDQITDTNLQCTLAGRVLGHGTIRIESAGQRQGLETLDYVPDAPAVYRAVLRALSAP